MKTTSVEIKAGRIILPDEVNGREDIRKAILGVVTDPRAREFERLKSLGLDSETAAYYSELGTMDSAAEAAIRLESASIYQPPPPSDNIKREMVTQASVGMRGVGSAMGAALGQSAGVALLGAVARNSSKFIVGGSAIAGVVGGAVAFATVSPVLGKGWAVVAAAGTVLSSTIVVLALLKR